MTFGLIILGLIALVGSVFMLVLMYAVFLGLCEDTARLALRVHDHTNPTKKKKR